MTTAARIREAADRAYQLPGIRLLVDPRGIVVEHYTGSRIQKKMVGWDELKYGSVNVLVLVMDQMVEGV